MVRFADCSVQARDRAAAAAKSGRARLSKLIARSPAWSEAAARFEFNPALGARPTDPPKAIDPVCKKQFEQGRARRCEMVLGCMHYFCSNACHNQFLATRGR